ncbi:MAG: hypothetical protein OXH53_02555 [bacterium]|nr:hypothetical protein [bacterium]MCY3632096.1 hypothetical protein [bacterium]
MALPMYDQPQVRPALTLVSDCPSQSPRRPVATRLPAPVYWFRRALAVSALFLVLWASSFAAGKLHWSLSPEAPAAGLSQSEPAYVIVGDTALRVSSDGR